MQNTQHRGASAQLWPHDEVDWVFADFIEKIQDQHNQFREATKLFPTSLESF